MNRVLQGSSLHRRLTLRASSFSAVSHHLHQAERLRVDICSPAIAGLGKSEYLLKLYIWGWGQKGTTNSQMSSCLMLG